MINVTYKCDVPKSFSLLEKEVFVEMLLKQQKVVNPSLEKINRCKFLCTCFVNEEIVSIGAIKPKSVSDFNPDKANLKKLSSAFSWELGYCYTNPDFAGRGFSSTIVHNLILEFGENNLMASTELRKDNAMVRILEKFSFKQYGNPWESRIHGGILGLYLRFVK